MTRYLQLIQCNQLLQEVHKMKGQNTKNEQNNDCLLIILVVEINT